MSDAQNCRKPKHLQKAKETNENTVSEAERKNQQAATAFPEKNKRKGGQEEESATDELEGKKSGDGWKDKTETAGAVSGDNKGRDHHAE
jgi:hypothetical protein